MPIYSINERHRQGAREREPSIRNWYTHTAHKPKRQSSSYIISRGPISRLAQQLRQLRKLRLPSFYLRDTYPTVYTCGSVRASRFEIARSHRLVVIKKHYTTPRARAIRQESSYAISGLTEKKIKEKEAISNALRMRNMRLYKFKKPLYYRERANEFSRET